MLLTIVALGPGDSMHVHDEVEEQEQTTGKGITSMILMPPRIKRKLWKLQVLVHRAEVIALTNVFFGGGMTQQDKYKGGFALNEK